MANNFWNQNQYNGNSPTENNSIPQAGGLLREYRQSQQQAQQYSPSYSPSPMPPPEQGWSDSQTGSSNRGWITNTVQMVRTWSGRMVAVPKVDANPLVLYRPSRPLPQRSKLWKRSRTVRIAMQMRHRRERWKRAHPPRARYIGIGIVITLCLLLVSAASSGSAYAYGYYQSQLPRLQGLANQQIDQTTRIYDRHGNLLYDMYDNSEGRRTPVAYKYIPKIMQDAMVATEDKTFWDNSGIDPQAILRAGTQYLQSNSVQSGASTITQQLIKNLTGDTEISLNRKLTEGVLAIGLTQQYPKWKILEMYFNVAPFGSQELGIEAAVEDYFHIKPHCDRNFNCIPAVYYLDVDAHGKHDPILGLARASLLAGMPQNPVSYDPTLSKTNRDVALARQQEVLADMLALGGIQVGDLGPLTQDMVTQAEALTAKMTFTRYEHFFRCCQHFVLWVVSQVEAALGGGDPQKGVHAFLTGGFNIVTTVDPDLEHYVEQAVHRHLDQQEYQPFTGGYGPLNVVNNVNDSAVVVMDAKTGEVLAMDGSADVNSKDPRINGQFNAAISPRQPGSSFKPIIYATAFQMGWYPGLVLPDRKTYFPTSNYPVSVNIDQNAYHPQDYGPPGYYHNENSTIRLDIANSFNVPAVKALEFAGINNTFIMAQRLGITTLKKIDAGPSMALGTLEVPLLQLVGAYQVFADQGTHVPPQGVLDIWDNYGHPLYHYDSAHPQGVQVLSPQVAYLMTSILTDENARAQEFAGDHVLSMWDWTLPNGAHPEVAAKTGTTDSFKDNWAIGYTPNVVVGVWSGNADDTKFVGNVVGITGAAPIWHSVIERAMGRCNYDTDTIPCGNYHSPFTDYTFAVPSGLVQQCVSSANGLAGTGICDVMLASEVPQQSGNVSGGNGSSGTPTPTPTP